MLLPWSSYLGRENNRYFEYYQNNTLTIYCRCGKDVRTCMYKVLNEEQELPKHKQTKIIIFSFQIVKYNPFHVNKHLCTHKQIWFFCEKGWSRTTTCDIGCCLYTLDTFPFMWVLLLVEMGKKQNVEWNGNSIIIYEMYRICWNHLMWLHTFRLLTMNISMGLGSMWWDITCVVHTANAISLFDCCR